MLGLEFFAVLLQFGLIVMLVAHWRLEGVPVLQVLQLALGGFAINHFLPSRFRLPFFALFSIAATVSILGELDAREAYRWITGRTPVSELLYRLVPGGTVIAIGSILIGLCHLPIPFNARVVLLISAALCMAFVRMNGGLMPDIPVAVWVILGSMFIFRLMVYMYDLKHRAAPFSPARAFSYFFMIPNVCFPLFPLVDYKTFCSTYYNEDWIRIYQTGLRWMLRGVVQLLLYRFIYQFAPLDVAKLSTSLDAVGFMLGTYLLYLHVSGQFHLIVGLLHMFGFNLPETHHLFLLASSFTDFWRRINIYWKDFIMKLFFYPFFFAVRKMGTLPALALATLATFFITWFLHSWQWFWFRGSFLFTWQDISFWTILGILVLVNGLYEATTGRKRKLKDSKLGMRDRAVLGLKTIGTFAVICVLWTLWSCQSGDELRTLVDAASQPRLTEIVIIFLVLLAIGVSGMIWGRSSRDTTEGKAPQRTRGPFYFWRSAALVSATAGFLLVLPLLASTHRTGERVVAQIRNDSPNARDLRLQRRGYYEELDQSHGKARQRMVAQGERESSGMPEGWQDGAKTFYRDFPSFLLREIVPSTSATMRGAVATSNPFGMRDRDYEKTKPATTFRAMLLGSSHEMGSGVKNEETFEKLVEERLNNEAAESRYLRYEILNGAVGGDCILQKLIRFESSVEFKPDAALFCIHALDRQMLLHFLRKIVMLEITPPVGYRELLDEITAKAGVHGKMPDLMIERRLEPYLTEIFSWSFRRLAQRGSEVGIYPVVVYRPAPLDWDGIEATVGRDLIRLAQGAGLKVIDLSSAFDSVEDRSTLVLAQWDDHTTAVGHKLLAGKLYEGVASVLLPTFETPSASR
jgi:hypothetical protein